MERVDRSGPAADVLVTINDYLFGELGFAGNEEDYYSDISTARNGQD